MAFWFFGKEKDDKIKKIEGNLKDSFSNIRKDFKFVHDFLDHFGKKHDDHDQRFEKLEKELELLKNLIVQEPVVDDERSIIHERSIAINRSNQSFMNVQSLKNNITPAQKKVIHVLSVTDLPLEYEDLAKELGISIITVRRHLNDLKKMGFNVKEKVNIENSRKVFFLEKTTKKAIMQGRKRRV